MTTIIQPIVIPVERNCIIEQGTRYCEQAPISKIELGIILLSIILITAWLVSVMYLYYEERSTIASIVFFTPIIILLIYLFT